MLCGFLTMISRHPEPTLLHTGTMITNIYNDAGNIKRAKVALRLRSAAGVLLYDSQCFRIRQPKRNILDLIK
jgi:hypothetical protein